MTRALAVCGWSVAASAQQNMTQADAAPVPLWVFVPIMVGALLVLLRIIAAERKAERGDWE